MLRVLSSPSKWWNQDWKQLPQNPITVFYVMHLIMTMD